MSTALIVDGFNLLFGLQVYPGGQQNFRAALHGLRSHFGALQVAQLFCESSLAAQRKDVVREATAAGFRVSVVEPPIESAIITALIELSHDHHKIILVSSDGDFASAVQAVLGRGVAVSVVATLPSLSDRLRYSGASIVDLAAILRSREDPSKTQSPLTPDDTAFLRRLPATEVATLRAISAGLRLEQHLKTLCRSHNLPVTDSAGISVMNDSLLKCGAYGKVLHRKIALWGAIRNEAAHAGQRAFSREDLRQMELGVDGFVNDGGGA